MAENIINKVLKDERPFYQQAFENSIDALPDDLSTGHGKAMYTPNGIVDRAQSVGDYHKMANADLSNRISNKIGENYGNLAQAGYNLFSPALSIPASFGYDYSQAKDRMEPDSGIMGLGKAFMDESPFSAAYQRAVGVADPFFQQFGMTTVPENALKNNLRPANINFTNLLQQDVNKDIYNGYRPDQPRSFRSMTQDQNIYEPEKLSLFQRGKDLVSSGIGKAGKVGRDAFNMLKNSNPMGLLTSGLTSLGKMDNFKNLNELDRNFILDQSGGNRPSKDPFGINTRSAFGNYGAYVDNLYEKDKDKVYDPVTQKFLYDRKVFNDKLATKRAADLFIAQQEATAAKERAANVEFQRLAAANRARDESSGTGGVGETVDGTFGSSVNNSSTFSDYS